MERIIKFRQFADYLVVVLVCLTCKSSAFIKNTGHAVTSSSHTYDVIMRDFWIWRLEDSPEFAASVGMERQRRRLDSFSLQAFDHSQRKAREFLRMTDSVSLSEMSTLDIRNLHLLRSDIETFLRGYNWRLHGGLNPVNSIGGVHTDFTYWLDAMSFDDLDTCAEYSVRLTALASQVHAQIELMKEAVRLKITNHRLSMTGVVESIETLLSQDPESTSLYSSFVAQFERVTDPGSTREKLKLHTAAVIKDHVQPAFGKLSEFLREEYLPNCRPNPGLLTLPSGSMYYEACLRWFIGGDVTADRVYDLGQVRIQEILNDVDNVRIQAGYRGSVADFLKYAHGASKFFYRSQNEIIEAYKLIIQREIPLRLPSVCAYPRLESVEVVEMTFPGPDAVLMPGDEASGQPAVFFVNVNNIFKRQKWKLLTTALHEYIPGRHFQNIHERNQSVPYFRKFRDYRKLHRVPYHFPIHSSYTEGWALYAEALGFDMGLYERTYDRLGAHFSELLHMAKMIADTGIHSRGWTETQAVNYIMTLTGCDHTEASIAVQQIVTSPGKSAAPPYGMITIKILRQKAEKLLGSRFHLTDFHRHLLNMGPMSLKDVESGIAEWISRGSAPNVTSHAVTFIIISLTFYFV